MILQGGAGAVMQTILGGLIIVYSLLEISFSVCLLKIMKIS